MRAVWEALIALLGGLVGMFWMWVGLYGFGFVVAPPATIVLLGVSVTAVLVALLWKV